MCVPCLGRVRVADLIELPWSVIDGPAREGAKPDVQKRQDKRWDLSMHRVLRGRISVYTV